MASGNVGGGVSFFDGGKTFSGTGTFGSQLFGGVGFSFTDFDDTDLSFKNISGSLGYEVTSSETEVSFCPSFGAGYGFGLEIVGVDLTTVSVVPAVSVSIVTEVSPTVSIVPFGQLALVYQRITADGGTSGEITESDTTGALVLGAGFMFNQRFSIGPAVTIPISSEDGDTTFGIGFAVAVGEGGS
jgi:hypothetical protein